jgi:hypothetical protein
MTKASSHPMGAASSSCASAVHRSSPAKSEFYPKTRWQFCNEFRCKRKRAERLSSQPCRKTNRSLNTRYPVIRSSGSSSPRLRGSPFGQRRKPNDPCFMILRSNRRPPAEGNIGGLRFVGANGALIVRALVGFHNQRFRFSAAATCAIDSGRPIERRPPRSNDCRSSQ